MVMRSIGRDMAIIDANRVVAKIIQYKCFFVSLKTTEELSFQLPDDDDGYGSDTQTVTFNDNLNLIRCIRFFTIF